MKFRKIAIFLILAIIITVGISSNFKKTEKDEIQKIVKSNVKILNSSIEKGDLKAIEKINGVKKVEKHIIDDKLYIDFFCNGKGIASSSIYYGFYYSEDDKPISLFHDNIGLSIDEENGWIWHELDGDNYYKTDKIVDNWYYYEAGF